MDERFGVVGRSGPELRMMPRFDPETGKFVGWDTELRAPIRGENGEWGDWINVTRPAEIWTVPMNGEK